MQIFEGAKIIKNYQYIAMESIDSKFGNAKDVLKLMLASLVFKPLSFNKLVQNRFKQGKEYAEQKSRPESCNVESVNPIPGEKNQRGIDHE